MREIGLKPTQPFFGDKRTQQKKNSVTHKQQQQQREYQHKDHLPENGLVGRYQQHLHPLAPVHPDAVQSLDGFGKVTPDDKVPHVPIPKMFRTNLANTGLIFPKNHPYYSGIPKAELRKSIAWLEPNDTYQSVVIGDHEIDIHPLHGAKELEKNINACADLLQHNPDAKIQLLPILNEQDAAVRAKFYPKDYIEKYPNKNADAIYNNKVIEFESPNGSKKSIQNAIKHGKEQADTVIIHINKLTDYNDTIRIANGHIKAHYKDTDFEVWILNKEHFTKVK